jgi:hypothetical protein
MNILVVSISAPPKNSPESLQTGRYIKGLAARHHVTLITGKAVKGWEPYDASVSGYLKSVKKIIELTPLPYRIVALLKKFLPGIVFPDDSFYFIRKLNKLKRITEKPDIIISRALPYTSCVLASGLAKHWNVPWIMHLSDPWADSPFMHLDEREKRRQQQLEKKCIEQAARVSLTSRKTVTFYKNKYPHCEDKFILLPNVFDDEQVNAVPVDFDWPLKFVFTGRLYGKRSVDVLPNY